MRLGKGRARVREMIMKGGLRGWAGWGRVRRGIW